MWVDGTRTMISRSDWRMSSWPSPEPCGPLRIGDLVCQFRLTDCRCQSMLTDMDNEELSVNLSSDDPAIGLRASLALHRLAERVEAKPRRVRHGEGLVVAADR